MSERETKRTVGELIHVDLDKHRVNQYSRFELDEKTKYKLLADGSKYAFVSFWATNLNERQLVSLLSEQGFGHGVLLSLADFDTDRVVRPKQNLYRPDGKLSIKVSADSIPVAGKYLRVSVGANSADDGVARARHDHAICSLRLSAGFGAAAEEIVSYTQSLTQRQFTYGSAGAVVWPFYLDQTPIDSTWSDLSQKFSTLKFSLEAESKELFLAAAQHLNDPKLCYLLLFIALEKQIGRGPRIKQYFQKKTGCKLILGTLEVQSRKRGSLVHSGDSEVSSIDCLVILALLRISACSDSVERDHAINDARKIIQKA